MTIGMSEPKIYKMLKINNIINFIYLLSKEVKYDRNIGSISAKYSF